MVFLSQQNHRAHLGFSVSGITFSRIGYFVGVSGLGANLAIVGAVPIAIHTLPRIDEKTCTSKNTHLHINQTFANDTEMVVLAQSWGEDIGDPDEVSIEAQQHRSSINTAIVVGADKENAHAVIVVGIGIIDNFLRAGAVGEMPHSTFAMQSMICQSHTYGNRNLWRKKV